MRSGDYASASDGIDRAIDVFGSYLSPDGPEVDAASRLRAEARHGAGDWEGASIALEGIIGRMQPSDGSGGGGGGYDDDDVAMRVALSKTLFYGGRFSDAYGPASIACEVASEGSDAVSVAMRQGVSMSCMAAVRLGMLPPLEEAEEEEEESGGEDRGERKIEPRHLLDAADVREVLSVSASVLRNGYARSSEEGGAAPHRLALAGAASYGNLGIADLTHQTLRTEALGMPRSNARLDGCMMAWRNGLSLLDDLDRSGSGSGGGSGGTKERSSKANSDLIRARLHASMAHALLHGRGGGRGPGVLRCPIPTSPPPASSPRRPSTYATASF